MTGMAQHRSRRGHGDAVEGGRSRLVISCDGDENSWRAKNDTAPRIGRSVRGVWMCAVLLGSMASLAAGKPLLGGSLTWSISPEFANGDRMVTFTLLTAFEMDLRCTYTLGEEVSCASDDFGVLCVDQYYQRSSGTEFVAPSIRRHDNLAQCEVGTGPHTGTHNSNFHVVRTKNVNGVNVVFGKKTHTVFVNSTTNLILGYWQPATANARGLMDVCDRNGTNVQTPCAINDLSNFPRSRSSFWTNPLRNALPSTPALETLVPVCTTEGDYFSCSDTNGTDPLGNYYSPMPVFPSFVEVAETPRTRFGRPTNVAEAWFYNVSGDAYAAPHQPFLFKSVDYDGQQMTQYSPAWIAGAGVPVIEASNLGLECFNGFANGSAAGYDPSGQGTWQFADSTEGRCGMYFDGDGGGGSRLKFDFDFGYNLWAPPAEGPNYVREGANTTMSILFGSDQFRCAGRGLQTCSPTDEPSTCSQNGASTACSGNAMFSQHSVSTLDLPFLDVDNLGSTPHISSVQRWYSFGGMPISTQVQSVFSAYPCSSGTSNQPPVFVKELDQTPRLGPCNIVDLPLDYPDAVSEVRCRPGELCLVPLHAQDFSIDANGVDVAPGTCAAPAVSLNPERPISRFQSLDTVQIELAPGWDEGNFSMTPAMCEGTTTRCLRDGPGCVCTNGGDMSTHVANPNPKCQGELGAAKCFFREVFATEDAGKHRIRCFVAKDPHGDREVPFSRLHPLHPLVDDGKCDPPAVCQPSEDAKTCRSAPMCVKIVVEGRAPYFTEPTPLEANSLDESGQLIQGQTDVPACEGFPMQLTIAARDDDPLDRVRIFVEDNDNGESAVSQADPRLQLLDFSGAKNLDFFADTADIPPEFWSDFPQQCLGVGAVSGVNSTFGGYGAEKTGDNAGQASILAVVGRRSVVSPYANHIEYVAAPQLSVEYTLSVANRNGIVVRRNCQHRASPSCREKLLNMDQLICGKAYDDSRFRLKRWVGEHDPNRDELSRTLRDHSNGDMTSARHCWRIRLQAPPVFVTSPARDASPFSDSVNVVNGTGEPVSGRTSAYKRVQAVIGENVTYRFVAQDPNPEDAVRIFIVDDPGLPPGMMASPVACLPRAGDGEEAMCSTRAEANANQSRDVYRIDPATPSACSKAELVLTWEPTPQQAGIEFRVCVVARDSSTLCAGKGPPDATSAGWYGEQHCIDVLVVQPELAWVTDMSPSDITSYVGCETRFYPKAADVGENYGVVVEPQTELPAGATVEDVGLTGAAVAEVKFSWRPPRGAEGGTTTVCFTAQDALRTQAPLEPRCWRITVGKCRYCVGRGDTLSLVMKDYGLDSNWLRLWLHNGNTVPPSQPGPAIIPNPDLIVSPHEVATMEEEFGNAGGLPVIYVGPVYGVHHGESLHSIALRFRTSIKAILSLNPDITGEADVVPGRSELCLVPCSQRREKTPTATTTS